MLRLNNLFGLSIFLPLSLILPLGFLHPNTFLSAKTPKLTTYSATLSSANPTSPNPMIADLGAFGSLLSGVVAILAFVKAQKNEREAKKVQSALIDTFDELIKTAKNEAEKQRILEKKQFFEEQFKNLANRANASKQARKWLENNRENSLVDDAVNYALKNESVREDVRKEFRLHINQYLYIIQECLNPDIGRFNLIDQILEQLRNKHQLPRRCYEDALRFVIKDEAPKKLPSEAVTEMKIYFKYLMNNLP